MPKQIQNKRIKPKTPRGRPKNIHCDDDVNELEKVQDDENVLIQITWGPHWVLM